jgi:hypothetical protein
MSGPRRSTLYKPEHASDAPARRSVVHLVGHRLEVSDGGPWSDDAASRLVLLGRKPTRFHAFSTGILERKPKPNPRKLPSPAIHFLAI